MKDVSSSFDAIDESVIKSIFEHTTSSRLHEKDDEKCSIETLMNLRLRWQEEKSIVVFTAGVFDILHVNHLLALTHYRLLGAKEYLSRDKALTAMEHLQDIAASDKVRLIVSVDSDPRVAADKAFVTSKGNCLKPLVSWDNRALLLARQQISKRDGSARPLVDFITMHGEGSCACIDCPHGDNAYIADAIKPDLVVVSSSSPSTIQKLHGCKALEEGKLVVIKEGSLFYYDKLLAGPIKSSSIIKRAQATQKRSAKT